MSDSSSVDRWHPSNVEWPKHKDGTPNRTIGPTNPAFLTGYYRPGKGPEVVPLAAYEALYADRGRVLAAARELAEAVAKELDETEHGWIFNYANPDSDAIGAALAAFREVDHG